MKMVIASWLHLLLIVGLGFSFVACSSEEDGNAAVPSTGDPGDNPIDDVPVGEVEDTGFWVNVNTNDQFDVFMKKRGQWDEDCFIDKDSTDYEAIECTLDILEMDLYMHEIEMQYNAPPGLCDHVGTYPSWFWNESAGTGPSAYTLNIDSSTDPSTLTSCTVQAETALEILLEGGGYDANNLVDCALHPEIRFTPNGMGVDCIYNYRNVGGPNCCFGDVLATVNEDDGVIVETTITPLEWGGSAGACISPHINNGWGTFSDTGVPLQKLQTVPRDPDSDNPVGLNDAIKLSPNASTTLVNFSTWANWWEAPGAANGHTHTGYFSATTTNVPYAFWPVDDLSGSAAAAGSPSWIFVCYDSGGEIRQRIDLYIREWNTLADFVAYETSDSVTYNPDVTGAEGTACDYDPLFGYDNCNDFNDFDDILTDVGGTYLTTDPTVQDNSVRRTYFPQIED